MIQRKYSWSTDREESYAYNLVCHLEVTLWNLGIPSVGTIVAHEDWPSRDVRSFADRYYRRFK